MIRWRTATAAIAALVYLVLWVGYERQWDRLAAFDRWFLEPAHEVGSAHSGWVTAWDVFCTVLGPETFIAAALILIVVFVRRQMTRPALFLFVCVALSWAVTQTAKWLADRPRPETALVTAWSTSFPSGHALGVLVGVLGLLTVLLPMVPVRRRVWFAVAGAVVVAAIGAGRVVLNVHHPSDVIAGWALGYLYFLACMPLLRPGAGEPEPSRRGRDPKPVRQNPAHD